MTKKSKQIQSTLFYFKYPLSIFQNVSPISALNIGKKGSDNDFLNEIFTMTSKLNPFQAKYNSF